VIVQWSPEAIDDLASLRAYVAEHNPAAAKRVVLQILRGVDQLLSNHPEIGRPGRVPGTRELVIERTPYIVPYRVRDNRIQVLRVHYTARRRPERF
jgi:toxin ParE1/3/4